MICPNCKSTKSKVLDTGREGEIILRRRECKECGERFNTCEALTQVSGTRTKKTNRQKRLLKSTNAIAASKVRSVKNNACLISGVEAKRKRAERTKRRRDAEDMEEYYSEEYVDTLVSDDEVKDLLELFGEN